MQAPSSSTECTQGSSSSPNWEELPQELQIMVYGFLDFPSLFQCFTVSKKWSEAASDDLLWHYFYDRYKEVMLEEVSTPEQEAKASAALTTWQQRFHRLVWRFCFHPLISDESFTLSQSFKQATRKNRLGSCPKLVLSSVHSAPLLYQDLSKISYTERGRAEKEAMYTNWEGKVVELKFLALRPWEVAVCHNITSFSQLAANRTYFSHRLPNRSAVLSLFDDRLLCSIPGAHAYQQPLKPSCQHLPSSYKLGLKIDGIAHKVTFTVNGQAYPSLPTPENPFVVAFSTGYTDAELSFIGQSVSSRSS